MDMSIINKEQLEDLFVTFVAGGLDEEAKKELEHQLSSSAELNEYWLMLYEIWLSSISPEDSGRFDKERAYERLMQKVNGYKDTLAHPVVPTRKKQGKYWQIAVAAACLALVAIMSFISGKKQVESLFTDIVIEAPEGSRTITTLPDGSRICLNAGAKLTYSQGFGVQDRKVSFVGEGHFNVAGNERLPFMIMSENIKVTVIGTEFSIRDNPEDREIVVALYKGRLRLDNRLTEDDIQEMVTDDVMVMDKQEGIMRIKSNSLIVNNKGYSENGYMIFDEIPLSDILNSLHLNYGVDFVVRDQSVLANRYRGIFIKDEQTVEDILKVFASASGGKLHYEMKGKSIVIF